MFICMCIIYGGFNTKMEKLSTWRDLVCKIENVYWFGPLPKKILLNANLELQ